MDRTLSDQAERSIKAVGQGRAAGSHCPLRSRARCSAYRSLPDGGHSLLIDGVLVPAELLINGATITRDEVREYDELEYIHVKLESHDVIYAEGVPAETLINVQESAVNFADYLRRYGTAATDEEHCAPYIHIWGGRPELASRLRSALSPWIDLRNQAEVIRDRLEEYGYVSSCEPEIA
jgi:hypothetical protein